VGELMDRRIGGRRATPGLQVAWTVPRRTRWSRKQVDETVEVVDVSPSGMAVVAHTVPDLPVRSVVPVRFDRFATRAVIRRIEPADGAQRSRYGLQFLDPSPDHIEALLGFGGAPPRETLEAVWRRAT
jgi:hypothetical protein